MEQLYVEHQRKLCRLCLRIADSGKDLISIFDHVPNPADPKNKVSFAYFLKEISTVKVTLHDGLPAKICNLCVQQLPSLFVFKTQIEKSNLILEKVFKSKSNQTTNLINFNKSLTVSPKHNGPPSRTKEPVNLCLDSEGSEVENHEVIREEPPTARQSASKQSVITIETNPSNVKIPSFMKVLSSSTPKTVERNEKKIFTSQVDKCNIQQTDESSSVNVQNPKNAIVVLEKLDSLKNIFPCKTCGRFFCTEIAYLRHDFTCVNSCKTCKISFKNNELNFKAHFTKRHNLNLMDNVTVNGNEPDGDDHQHNRTYTKDEFEKKFMVSRSQGTLRCNICVMTFEKKKLQIHLNTRHLVNRPFKCSFCDDKFFVGSKRTEHMSKKHPQDYKCVLCDSQFIQHAFLEKHSLSLHNISTSVPKSPLEVDDPKPETFLYVEKKQPIEMNSSNTEFQFRTPKAMKSVQPKQKIIDTKVNSNMSNNGINKSLTTTQPARRQAISQPDSIMNTEKSNKLKVSPTPRKLTIQEPMNTEDSEHEDGFDAVDFLETEMMAFDVLAEVANDTIENRDHEHELEEIATTYTYEEFFEKFVQKVNDTHSKCTPCDNEIKKHRMKFHIRNCHALKPSFFCELCPESFMKYEQRMQHMKKMHTDDFKCELCDKQFIYSMTFKEHMLYVHSEAVDIKTLKTNDEIDLPLEEIQFREKAMRSELRGRPAGLRSQDGKKRGEPVGPEEFTLERFKHNFIVSSKSGKMQCSICSVKIFQTTMLSHILDNHVLTDYIFCEICDESFNTDSKRKEHMGEAHPGKQKCVLCEIQYTKESTYLHHMKASHNLHLEGSGRVKKDNLPVEELVFTDEHPNLTKMSGHCFEYVPDDIEMTKYQFYTKYIRIRKDDSTRVHCMACGLGFVESTRRSHLDTYHTSSKQFACELCQSRFKFRSYLKNHMSSRHSQEYKCSICEIQFLKCQQLIDHNKDEHGIALDIVPPDDYDLHPDEIKYVRVLESNITDDDNDKSKNVLEENAVVEKIFCQYCNEEFDSPRLHRLHIRLDCKSNPNNNSEEIVEEIEQEEEKEHPCEFCGKIFTSALSLKGHTNWHKKDLNQGPKSSKSKRRYDWEYECNICNETSRGLNAYSHMTRCHKQEFKCGQCDNQSSTFLRLKLHIIKNHPRKIKLDMSKRHKCPHCFRYFAVADCLNDHITNKHQNLSCEDVINCAACEMRFDSERDQASHFLTYHHGVLQQLFDKETERDLDGAEEIYDEDQDSFFDEAENLNATQLRKRGRRDSSISSSSSMTSATEASHNDDFAPPPIKKEKIDLELIETSKAADENGVSYLNFMRTIDGDFECVICNTKENNRELMLQHLKQHDEVPRFKCETCLQEFLVRPLYNNHLLICQQNQSNSSANRCEICNKDFKLSIMLKQHNAKVHGGDDGTQKEND